MKMKKLIIFFGILALLGIVFAQTFNLKGDQGKLVYDTSGIIKDQKFRNCLIQEPIGTRFEITSHDETSKTFNYTARLDFGGKCTQGIGSNLQVNYANKDMKQALIDDLKSRFNEEFSKKTIKKDPKTGNIKGSFSGS